MLADGSTSRAPINLWNRLTTDFEFDGNLAETRARQMRRIVSAAALILIASTWRLWTPQTAFPQIPLFEWAGRLPSRLDWFAVVVMLVALAVALLAPKTSRLPTLGLLAFASATVGTVFLNQHRLQPWTYQFLVVAFVLGTVSDRRALSLLRLLVISIYFHSALSKIDHSFIHTNGQQLVAGLLNALGQNLESWPTWVHGILAAMLPIGELAAAVGLCLPKFRRMALLAVLIMHALLLVALSSWGLGHKPGVLIWNVYFMVQNIVLFGPVLRRSAQPARTSEPMPMTDRDAAKHAGRFARLTEVAVAAVILLPLLEPFGWFDHWPAWALYASRPERLMVFVDASEREKLPPELKRHIGEPRFIDNWCRVHIDRWSLEVLNAPIYPQNRFRLGVALAVARQCRLGRQIRVEIETAANRRTGRRSSRLLRGKQEIIQEIARYQLNAFPRAASVEIVPAKL